MHSPALPPDLGTHTSTLSCGQVRTHAQKYFMKLDKHGKTLGELGLPDRPDLGGGGYFFLCRILTKTAALICFDMHSKFSHFIFYHESEQCSLIIFVSNLQLTRQTLGPSHIHGRNWCSAQDSWLNACLGPGLFAAVITHCKYFLWVFRLFLFCDEVD